MHSPLNFEIQTPLQKRSTVRFSRIYERLLLGWNWNWNQVYLHILC